MSYIHLSFNEAIASPEVIQTHYCSDRLIKESLTVLDTNTKHSAP